MEAPDADPTGITAEGPLTPKALAREYNQPSYSDTWAAITDYQRVLERHAETGKKSAALASEMDLPRARIRSWLGGSVPDAVRAIRTAADYGWFEWDGSTAGAMAVLAVATRAGGSISTASSAPTWTVEPQAAGAMVAAALKRVGVGCQHRTDGYDPELCCPATDATVLGRALVALGITPGDTNERTSPLPEWLLGLPPRQRRPAVVVLVLYRGVTHSHKETLTVGEHRSRAYRDSVVRLFDGVVDGRVTAGDRWVTVQTEAVRQLGFGHGMELREAIE
jgi:hypothetical protein